MAITDMSDPNTMIGAPVHSTDGQKLGRIESIYYDNGTNRPAWAATRTGLFGGHVSLVSLAPTCARHGVQPGQVDMSARVIWLFGKLGWADDVRWPTPSRMAKLHAHAATPSITMSR
ncbi:MAG: Stearoyl-CoA 9-desaturase [Pseudonocardia sp.]|jgi:hypothetical protein|nr:Stearoyl-CoA 9-desaturase [Pseudonocardia sp.]